MLTKAYLNLFNAITDAILILQAAQRSAEEHIISDDTSPLPFDEK